MNRTGIVFLFLGVNAASFAQSIPATSSPLIRRYHEGETLIYRMKGANDNWRYEIQATGIVKTNPAGKFLEEYAWSNLVSNGEPFALPPASLRFRQMLSLDPAIPPSVPNLSAVQSKLVGPITDLLTFYVDLWLAAGNGSKLAKAGDHVYQKIGIPASWADGTYVIVGEDSVDFDITLGSVDQAAKTARLLVRHVPPEQPRIRYPAPWLKEPVADTPNNWIEVAKRDGKFVASSGKETFDVQLEISLVDGKILSGSIENPVVTRERDCEDAALTNCGEPSARKIFRKIELTLVR